jgi:integrase
LSSKHRTDCKNTTIGGRTQIHFDKYKYKTSSYTFVQAVEICKTEKWGQVSRGDLSQKSAIVFQSRAQRYLLPRWADSHPATIGYPQISELVADLSGQNKSSATIGHILQSLRAVLTIAARYGIISAVPQFPSIKKRHLPRRSFTPKELLRLYRALNHQTPADLTPERSVYKCTKGGILGHTYSPPKNTKWIVAFMVNTFTRPTDIKNLRNRDIERVSANGYLYLRLTPPMSKGHEEPMISLRPAVWIYDRILQSNEQDGFGGPDDYLFLPNISNRDDAMLCLGKIFARALGQANISRQDESGRRRTLYSLRHTAITQQLLRAKNIDLLTLARNARTSVTMIERFYSTDLRAEQNIHMFHEKTRKRSFGLRHL